LYPQYQSIQRNRLFPKILKDPIGHLYQLTLLNQMNHLFPKILKGLKHHHYQMFLKNQMFLKMRMNHCPRLYLKYLLIQKMPKNR
jgi:hypothetical protein